MITFNTQEEFEEAVMAVIRERLTLYLSGEYTNQCFSQLIATLRDNGVPFTGVNI